MHRIGWWCANDWSAAMYGARFSTEFTPEDAIGAHACSLEANMRATNGIPLGCLLLLPVGTVNCVQTLKGNGAGGAGDVFCYERHVLELLSARIVHTHARVGTAEAPQLGCPPPGVTELERTSTAAHEQLWLDVWKAHHAVGRPFVTVRWPRFGVGIVCSRRPPPPPPPHTIYPLGLGFGLAAHTPTRTPTLASNRTEGHLLTMKSVAPLDGLKATPEYGPGPYTPLHPTDHELCHAAGWTEGHP
jgi:hypothetical protein